MREKYESLSLAVLKELAKARGMKKTSALRKGELIEMMLKQDELDAQNAEAKAAESEPEAKSVTNMQELRQDQTSSESRNQRSDSRTGEGESRQGARNTPSHSGARNTQSYSGQRNTQSYSGQRNTQSYSGQRNTQSYSGQRNTQPYSEQRNTQSYTEQRNAQTYSEQRNTQENENNLIRTVDDRTAQKIESEGISMADLDSGEYADGILEVMPDGYGFIRCENYLPGDHDVYVSPSQIRRFRLKTGDIIVGSKRVPSQGEKFRALLYISSVNGIDPLVAARRTPFEDLTPIFPNERIRMETTSSKTSMRIMDLITPVGKGQRGMIVSQPKAGKTTLLKEVATSVKKNHPEMHLIILLIDERPEEVTDIKEAIEGENVEVIYSTFDELPEHHKRVSEMVIERAKRLVEHKKDVMILLDSITRLARAYNLVVPPSGRTLSGGLDPAALHMPKRFFGAARNMREGGSLTILATALVDTGSRMDDVVFEEFKGTGNMELILDRKLSERRIFPAIDIVKSSTRREDLLLDKDEQDAVDIMRRAFNGMKADEVVETILHLFVKTRNNREFIAQVKRRKYF